MSKSEIFEDLKKENRRFRVFSRRHPAIANRVFEISYDHFHARAASELSIAADEDEVENFAMSVEQSVHAVVKEEFEDLRTGSIVATMIVQIIASVIIALIKEWMDSGDD